MPQHRRPQPRPSASPRAASPTPPGAPSRAAGAAPDHSSPARPSVKAPYESEASLALVLQQLPAILWTVDLQLCFTSGMGQGLKALGVPPQELAGVSLFTYFHSRDPEFPAIAAHRRALAGESVRYEFQWAARAYECYVAPLLDATQAIVGAIGVAVDVTERKEMEAALQQSERRFQTIFQQAGIGIVLSDLQGRILECNPAVSRILGYAPEELLQQHVQDFSHSEDMEEDRRRLAGLLAGDYDAYQMEKRYFRKGGGLVWSRLTVSRFPASGPPPRGVIGMFEDITAQKQAQEALRKSEAQYRTLLEGLHDGVYTLDLQGRFTFVNESIVKRSGRPREWFYARTFLEMIRPEDRPRVLRNFEAVRRGEAVLPYELGYPSASGQEIWIEVNTTPLQDGAQIVGVLGVSRDLTDRKRLEQELLEVSEGEQRRIGQDLHDGLGQQLTGISCLLQGLSERLAAQGLPEAQEVARTVQFLGQTITQTRDVARLLNPVELEEGGLTLALELLAERVANTAGISCTVTTEVPELRLDQSTTIHLYRIAQEAIQNALRHGKARSIQIRLCQDQSQLTLWIEDDGLGFAPAPQGPRAPGMGLRIMECRARMLGGQLTLRPRDGGGTVVACAFAWPAPQGIAPGDS